jgi:membrane-bound serine protease (ClpP class)
LLFKLFHHKDHEDDVNRTIGNIVCFVLTAAIMGIGGHLGAADGQTKPPGVYVIPIVGDVEPSMAAFLKRALNDIPDTKESLIVLEMDTFGGRLDAAYEMVDTLSDIKKAMTVAYVTNKAISAGALISLACKRLAMKKNTIIGDCAPIIYSNEGPKMMGEKFQSPLRAKFRALAKANGYPVVLAEAMVTAEMQVYRIEIEGATEFMDDLEYRDLEEKRKARITSKKTIVAKGELLTMDDSEAFDLGFAAISAESLADMLRQMNASAAPLIRIEPSWSEDLVRIIGGFAPILMLIGLGALYTEIKAPGFGAPGIIGILCLALVFFNQYLVGLADHTELLIFAIGIILLGFELFVLPGFGIAGIAGILLISVALLLSLQDFVIPDPQFPWEKALLINNLLKVLSAVIGSFLLALFVLRFIFPKLSKTVDGPYLAATLSNARIALTENTHLQIGHTGTALTLLRPSGKANIDGEIYDVVTQGEFVPQGSSIRVLKIKGTKIVVQGREPEDA